MALFTFPTTIFDVKGMVKSVFAALELKELYRLCNNENEGWWFVGRREGVSVVANMTRGSNYLWLFFFVDASSTEQHVFTLFSEMQRIFPENRFGSEEILAQKLRFADALIHDGKGYNE